MANQLHTLTNDIVVRDIKHKNSYNSNTIHRHNYYEVFMFNRADGDSMQIIDFCKYQIESDSIYIVAPGQVHLMKRLSDDNGILIQFTKEFLSESILPMHIDWYSRFMTNPVINIPTEISEQLFSYISKLKEIYNTESAYKKQKLQKMFGLIFFTILEFTKDQKYNSNNLAYLFITEVEKRFREIRIVKQYANNLNVTVSKLEGEVKKHFGKTPLQIINEILLTEIKRILITENISQKEITHRLNFDSQASYTRFIKRNTDLTPTELKNAMLEIHK